MNYFIECEIKDGKGSIYNPGFRVGETKDMGNLNTSTCDIVLDIVLNVVLDMRCF